METYTALDMEDLEVVEEAVMVVEEGEDSLEGGEDTMAQRMAREESHMWILALSSSFFSQGK